MATNETKQIRMIQKGRIDVYFPFTVDTRLEFTELRDRVSESVRKDIECHLAEIAEPLDKKLEKPLNDAIGSGNPVKVTSIIKQSVNPTDKGLYKAKTKLGPIGSISVELHPTSRGISLQITPEETKVFMARNDELAQEQTQLQELYSIFAFMQDRSVLLPLKVCLNNGKEVWINLVFCIFRNMMGVLKLELPLIDVSSEPLMRHSFSTYIDSIEDQWGMVFSECGNSIDDICCAYLNRIREKCGVDLTTFPDSKITNIIMVRYDGMPKQIENINSEIQEELYRIISAPVERLGCTSYKKEARDYLENHSWGNHNIRYIVSSNGGCLSVVDEAVHSWFQTLFKEEKHAKPPLADDVEMIDQLLIRSVCENVEFALVVLVLKRINTSCLYFETIKNPKEARNKQKKYNENMLMIANIQENCFGTASEQLADFEMMMPYYIKKEVTDERLKALDRIITDNESHRNNSFQSFVSIVSVIMALVFGLPAIHETLSIVRKWFCFCSEDIPFLSINNISVVLWLLLIALISFIILRINNKNLHIGQGKSKQK